MELVFCPRVLGWGWQWGLHSICTPLVKTQRRVYVCLEVGPLWASGWSCRPEDILAISQLISRGTQTGISNEDWWRYWAVGIASLLETIPMKEAWVSQENQLQALVDREEWTETYYTAYSSTGFLETRWSLNGLDKGSGNSYSFSEDPL